MDSRLQQKALPGEAAQHSKDSVGSAILKPLVQKVRTPGLVRSGQLHLWLAGDLEAPSGASVPWSWQTDETLTPKRSFYGASVTIGPSVQCLNSGILTMPEQDDKDEQILHN